MKITVIGHGNVGGALIARWVARGHQIVIGARNLSEEKLRPLVEHANVQARSIPESIAGTDVIVIAIPAHLTAQLAQELGDLSDRIVIDTTNSVVKRPEPYRTGFEAFQKITGAKVAKAFNSTGAENMQHPVYRIKHPIPHDVPVDMFVAGSDPEAKAIATTLSDDAGFVTYDFGGDEQVALLEELCRIWINLSQRGLGRDFALKVISRNQSN